MTMSVNQKKQLTMSENNPFSHTLDQNVPVEDKPQVETEEINVEELNKYLGFLKQKEKELENRLWKFPAKPKSKLDKETKQKIEKELDEVVNEIRSIKGVIRNNK